MSAAQTRPARVGLSIIRSKFGAGARARDESVVRGRKRAQRLDFRPDSRMIFAAVFRQMGTPRRVSSRATRRLP
jgi:hypothetical protein